MINQFKYTALAVLALFLTGCQTNSIAVTQEIYQVVKPPAALYKCPQVTVDDFPNPETATNQKIAAFVTLLYSYNKTCGYNLQAIRRYLDAAEARIKSEQGKS